MKTIALIWLCFLGLYDSAAGDVFIYRGVVRSQHDLNPTIQLPPRYQAYYIFDSEQRQLPRIRFGQTEGAKAFLLDSPDGFSLGSSDMTKGRTATFAVNAAGTVSSPTSFVHG
jgi:hypothetical protein